MILQSIWFAMLAGAMVYAIGNGMMGKMMEAALLGVENAIALTLRLGAGYLMFCGLLEIAKGAGVAGTFARLLRPMLNRLMPFIQKEETYQAAALNLSMNMLGLGNAATPLGMEAVRLMDAEGQKLPAVRHDLYMLLILNATSLQLLPTTVLAIRAAAGSADVQAIILPTLLCTAVSTLAGVISAQRLRRIGRWRNG